MSEREGAIHRTIDDFQSKMEAMAEAGTIPEDDPSDLMIDEWEKSCEKVDSEMEQEASEEEVSEEDSDSDGSLTYDDGFQEYEDWDDAGGVYQDGGEAYDNFDWNALD